VPACKAFLVEGDAEMDKYSTFALPESESDEARPSVPHLRAYSDLEIELKTSMSTCWNRVSRSRRQKFRRLDANPRYPSPRACW